MATTTPNFGWDIPQSTDLVKDGATAIAALGTDIDTALVDLKGGTTGQVLSKASNTDLDFTWVAQDDSNAIQNAIVDAKGDLISATAADTPARLAVGANDTVLTADSSTATGLKWATPSSGGMTLISTTTLSGTSVTLSSIPQTYNQLYLYVKNAVTTGGDGRFRFKPNNVTNTGTYITVNKTTVAQTVGGQIQLLNQNLASSNDNAFSLSIENYTEAAVWKPMRFQGRYIDSGSVSAPFTSIGAIYTANAITSMVLDFEDGYTFTGGTVLLYGVK